ncbi:MAG: caspase family protein [Thermoguttaceae bacterium]|nr:caspase family protein [Thermoguttaceae bacterium]
MSKRNRILAAALGCVATAGACGAFGSFAAFENRALFGEETSASGARPIVVAPRDGELAKPSGRKAFLVAADDYGDAANPLPCTKNDVKALKARLETLGFTTVVLETGGNRQTEPTKAIIERRFKRFVESLRPGDFALVYLSGHGLKPTDSDESFFAPVDVDVEDLFATSVSIDRMLADLKASDATFRWVIVDACRDDPTNPGDDEAAVFKGASKSFGAKALGQIASVPDSVALLQSCQPGKRSYEGGAPGAERIKNGFFTLSLLEALDDENSQADANGDGVLTFSETFEYVSRRTDELARESYGVSQVPNLSGSITNFALLDELLIDGLPKSEWNKADAHYREACVFRSQKRWRDALAKIKEAREINGKRQEYATAEAEVQAQVDALTVGEANALYQAAVNAFIANDLTTAKSKCEASLETFKTDAAQRLLKTINERIAIIQYQYFLKRKYQD